MNSMERWTSKRSIGVGLILGAILIMAIYSLTDNLLSAQANPPSAQRTVGILTHAPIGTTALLWSQSSQTLVVTVIVSGLAPNSSHPDAIHNGSGGGCTSPTHGDVVYGLNPVNADSTGKGTSVTTIPNVQQGIPGQGWYIDVHNGPQLTGNGQQERIACANIINPNALIPSPLPTTSTPSPSVNNPAVVVNINKEDITHGTAGDNPPPTPSGMSPTTSDQVVNVTLGGADDPDQNVSVGAVELSLGHGRGGQNRLTVKVFVYPLAPKSTHIAHIHTGSCESQGPVLYPLTPIHADAVGLGTSTTTVNNVSSIPSTGWYVNVHRASSKDDLNTQTGFDPIACVDISSKNSNPSGGTPTPTPDPPAGSPTPFIE